MRKIFVVRHGQTTSNVIKALDTRLPGAPLTELGRQQAYAVGEVLAHRSSAASVFSSDALRARATAKYMREAFQQSGARILAPSVLSGVTFSDSTYRGSVQSDQCATADSGSAVIPADDGAVHGIQEINAGDLEMREDQEAHTVYQGTILQWGMGKRELLMPGGDSGAATLERFVRGILSAALYSPQDAIVVSHGAMMRYGCSYLGGYSTIDAARRVEIRNGTFIQGILPPYQQCQELLSLSGEEFLTSTQGCIPIQEWVGVPITTPTHEDGHHQYQNGVQSHE